MTPGATRRGGKNASILMVGVYAHNRRWGSPGAISLKGFEKEETQPTQSQRLAAPWGWRWKLGKKESGGLRRSSYSFKKGSEAVLDKLERSLL